MKDVTGNIKSEDPEIFKQSASSGKHIITKNARHFQKIARLNPQFKRIGIVGIGIKSSKFIDDFHKVLDKLPYHEDYEGKLVKLGNKIVIKDVASTK